MTTLKIGQRCWGISFYGTRHEGLYGGGPNYDGEYKILDEQGTVLSWCSEVHPIEDQPQPSIPIGEVEAMLKEAWEEGFKLAVQYGDNWFHFDGEQKERQWRKSSIAAKYGITDLDQ